uniref:Uncharacterized protein n=1 Tax=Romanomermis culicivorax TaxID=13658 RepID=A0A915JW77_ROMCU
MDKKKVTKASSNDQRPLFSKFWLVISITLLSTLTGKVAFGPKNSLKITLIGTYRQEEQRKLCTLSQNRKFSPEYSFSRNFMKKSRPIVSENFYNLNFLNFGENNEKAGRSCYRALRRKISILRPANTLEHLFFRLFVFDYRSSIVIISPFDEADMPADLGLPLTAYKVCPDDKNTLFEENSLHVRSKYKYCALGLNAHFQTTKWNLVQLNELQPTEQESFKKTEHLQIYY